MSVIMSALFSELVAPHMKLRGGVEFVIEVPRSLSGKILRKHLRQKVSH